MSIFVSCPCGAKLKVSDSAAGKTLACPKCKTRLPVPSLSSASPEKATTVLPVLTFAKAPPAERATKRRRFPLWAIVTITVVACIGGFIIVALVAITALGTSSASSYENSQNNNRSGNAAPAEPKLLTRSEFKGKIMGKTEQEVLALVGKPDSTQSSGYWYYKKQTVDEITNKVDYHAQVVFKNGVVVNVNF